MTAMALESSTLQTPLPNPSLQVTADHKLKQVDTPVYAPKAGEVLVHIKATGVCGSDIHFWKTGRIGSLIFEGDCTIGHEAAGVVLKCGEGVTEFKPGDRVALEPGVPCGTCFLCLEGRYNLCPAVAFAGVYPYNGTLQRYKIHPAKWLHRLPDAISFAEGALLEPLSVVLHGIRTAGGGPGGSGGAVAGGLALGTPVLICGAGPIGLIALAAARASGAHPIVVTDVDAGRLEFAQRFVKGCRTYKVDVTKDAEENAREVRKLFGVMSTGPLGSGKDEYLAPRTVLECTGVDSSICTAAFACRRGGVVVVIGVGRPVINGLPFMHMSLAEIDLKFINRYRDTWPAGIACLEGGILDLKPLVTHTFHLEEAEKALEFSSDHSNGCIKVQIVDEVEGPLW